MNDDFDTLFLKKLFEHGSLEDAAPRAEDMPQAKPRREERAIRSLKRADA